MPSRPLTWRQWLRACSKDPHSPASVPDGSLAMLTGQDVRALEAISACWALYAAGDVDAQQGALRAVRALLPALQRKCHFFARELVAMHLDWGDRSRVWARLDLPPELGDYGL